MKKLLAIILAVSMVFSTMLINVSAFEAEPVEAAEETALSEEAEASLQADALKPGYNLMTATTDLLDFDGMSAVTVDSFVDSGPIPGWNVSGQTTWVSGGVPIFASLFRHKAAKRLIINK